MNKLIILLLLVPQIILAELVEWEVDLFREDDTPMTIDELKSFRIYWGVEPGVYTNSVTINDNMSRSHDLTLGPGVDHYLNMTAIDSDGRESKYNGEIFIGASEVIPIKKPSVPTDLLAVQKAGTFSYTVTFTEPVTYTDGEPLPIDAIVKHYPFLNGAWVRDIPAGTTSYELKLEVNKTYILNMETEIRTPAGGLVVSTRSETITIRPKENPLPPHTIIYTLPEGYKSVEITITPTQ